MYTLYISANSHTYIGDHGNKSMAHTDIFRHGNEILTLITKIINTPTSADYKWKNKVVKQKNQVKNVNG